VNCRLIRSRKSVVELSAGLVECGASFVKRAGTSCNYF
jgi:hypothetical protein